MKLKSKNRCLNFFKGIGCIGVVLAHVAFPGFVGRLIPCLFGWIVPLFYIISGYYSYRKDKKLLLKKIPSKIKHIFNITSIAFIVYLLYTIVENLRKGVLIKWLHDNISLKTIFNLFIFSDFDFLNAGPLWFLLSLVYCYVLLYIVVRNKKTNFIYYCIPLLLILRLIVPILPFFNYHYQQNTLIGAIPYFFLGYYLAEHSNILEKFNDDQLIKIIIGGLLFSILGSFIDIKISIFELGLLITSIAMFIYANHNPDKYFLSIFETIGEKYSLFIYVMHMLILQLTMKVLSLLPFVNSNLSGLLGILIVILSAYIFNIIINKFRLQKRLS